MRKKTIQTPLMQVQNKRECLHVRVVDVLFKDICCIASNDINQVMLKRSYYSRYDLDTLCGGSSFFGVSAPSVEGFVQPVAMVSNCRSKKATPLGFWTSVSLVAPKHPSWLLALAGEWLSSYLATFVSYQPLWGLYNN